MSPTVALLLLFCASCAAGKTTCVVQRLFRQWMDGRQAALAQPGTARHPRQLFVTASATLKDQVAKAFRRLQVRCSGACASIGQVPDFATLNHQWAEDFQPPAGTYMYIRCMSA
jgi:hypothetical protein